MAVTTRSQTVTQSQDDKQSKAQETPPSKARKIDAPWISSRTVAVQLSCATRVAFQANRLALGPLMVFIAAETSMSTANRGWVMSAFPLGYLLTQIPGGRFADLYGGKVALNMALIATTCCSLALPFVVGPGPNVWPLFLVSFAMGMLQGPTFPTNSVLLSRWVPPQEKSWASSISNLSDPLAGGIANLAVPALATAFGWRTASYVFGGVTAVFTLVWMWLGADSPESCWHTTAEERDFLLAQGCGSQRSPKKKGANQSDTAEILRVFQEPAIVATILAHSVYNFARYFIYSWMPMFYTEQFNVDAELVGRHLSFPEVASFLAAVIIAPLGDGMVKSGRMTPTSCRRWFTGGGFVASGFFLVLCAYSTQPWMATAMLTMVQCTMCLHGCGFRVSYIELTKEYSGLFSGVGNTFATFATFAGPLLTATILEQYNSWPLMFVIIFLFSVAGAVGYGALISTTSVDQAEEANSKRD